MMHERVFCGALVLAVSGLLLALLIVWALRALERHDTAGGRGEGAAR